MGTALAVQSYCGKHEHEVTRHLQVVVVSKVLRSDEILPAITTAPHLQIYHAKFYDEFETRVQTELKVLSQR